MRDSRLKKLENQSGVCCVCAIDANKIMRPRPRLSHCVSTLTECGQPPFPFRGIGGKKTALRSTDIRYRLGEAFRGRGDCRNANDSCLKKLHLAFRMAKWACCVQRRQI